MSRGKLTQNVRNVKKLRVPRVLAVVSVMTKAVNTFYGLVQVKFERKVANVYDIAPKVKIAGSGFDELDVSSLKLGFAPKLKVDKDYTIDIPSSTVMVLSLKEESK